MSAIKINVVRTPRGFTAADEEDAKKMNRFEEGEIVEFSIKRNRSYQQQKYYWKMIDMVYTNLPHEFDGMFPSKEVFHTQLKFLCGEVEMFESVAGGERFFKVKSTSFEGMDHEAFTKYVEKFKNAVKEYFIPEFEFGEIDAQMIRFYSQQQV